MKNHDRVIKLMGNIHAVPIEKRCHRSRSRHQPVRWWILGKVWAAARSDLFAFKDDTFQNIFLGFNGRYFLVICLVFFLSWVLGLTRPWASSVGSLTESEIINKVEALIPKSFRGYEPWLWLTGSSKKKQNMLSMLEIDGIGCANNLFIFSLNAPR